MLTQNTNDENRGRGDVNEAGVAIGRPVNANGDTPELREYTQRLDRACAKVGALSWEIGDIIRDCELEDKAAIAARHLYTSKDAIRELENVSTTFAGRHFRKLLPYQFYAHAARVQDSGKAIKLIEQARDEQLSLFEFRDLVRGENAELLGEGEPELPKPDVLRFSNEWRKLTSRLNQAVKQKPVDQWTPDERHWFLEEAEPVLQVLEKIKALD